VTLVPDGIPAALKLTVAAKVLNLEESTLKGWADRGELVTAQIRPGAMRFVKSCEVDRVAELLGIIPNWEAAL
jgi:hypothetical protein